MISKRRFSLPRLDITGMWVFSLGVWFHIVARLVYSKPWMAFFLAELIAAILVLRGEGHHPFRKLSVCHESRCLPV